MCRVEISEGLENTPVYFCQFRAQVIPASFRRLLDRRFDDPEVVKERGIVPYQIASGPDNERFLRPARVLVTAKIA